ncbi:MAG: response regulator transcription factor [Candidatus Wallbacteria bacterium]|nr:response regulator transcription factor [Candidatus Wallbacteria bacterium]
MTRILIVEDDPQIAGGLIKSLAREGYECLSASDGPTALEMARREKPDAMLLDLMIPGLHGIAVCKQLRKESRVPILILTARDAEAEKLLGLDSGADDYITKPFSLVELLARIRSVLRRSRDREKPTAVIRCGALEIDKEKRRVTLDGQEIRLKPTEFALLAFLASTPGKVFTRAALLDAIWKTAFEGYQRTVDTHVTRIRKKIERDQANPEYVLTVHGIGYKFQEFE